MAVLSCKLTSPEFQRRKKEVIASLKTKVLQKKELNDGYRYTFESSDETIDHIVSFIKTERVCCDFFTFNLLIRHDRTVIFLDIKGPEGAKKFINVDLEF